MPYMKIVFVGLTAVSPKKCFQEYILGSKKATTRRDEVVYIVTADSYYDN
jgi:hypothetical protein